MQKTAGEHIHTISSRVGGSDDAEFEAQVHGAERDDGTWTGWIEFHQVGATGRMLHTGQETSQHNRKALDYWAGGLDRIYLEGALARARE